MQRNITILLLFALTFALPIRAQEPVNEQMIARIKTEAFQHSQLLDTISWLSDVHGPRLKGSPEYKAAAVWARDRLRQWGLSNVALEEGGFTGPGWTLKRFAVEMTAPNYLNVIAYPMAWSPSTKGRVTGKPILVDIKGPQDFEKYRGKLKGTIVLNGVVNNKPATNFSPLATRFTEQELAQAATITDPMKTAASSFPWTDYGDLEKLARPMYSRRATIAKFFKDEGVAALLSASSRDSGVLRVADASGFDLSRSGFDFMLPNPDFTVPSFAIAREHYGRIARLLEKNLPVTLEVHLEATISEPVTDNNVIAELPGVDPRLREELVMLGGHLDSWQAGTGATDNAAGCAVAMEAMRILKAIDAQPRRTIRMALWNGEEGGWYGSRAYITKHFADPATMELKAEHAKLSAYFNLDNGSGRIRGLYLQGNEATRPIFAAWLKPFHELGATTLVIAKTGGTDHAAFAFAGLPGFQFIQDELDYTPRTHHSNMDVYESVLEDDLKQAALIVASFVYHAAMRDEKLPRPPLPKPILK